MKKKTLISVNLDKTPLVSLGSQELVYGTRFEGDACFQDTGPHRHDVASFGCVDSGMICIQTEKESFIVTTGMVVFTPPDCVHIEAGMGCPVTGWVVFVPADRVKFMPREVTILETSDVLLSLSKRIVSWGKIEKQKKTPAQQRLVKTYLDELSIAKPAAPLMIPTPTRKELRIVSSQVLKNPSDTQSLDHWASVAGMSRRSFTEYFREETGLTFAKWRQLVKLKESLSQLCCGKSVTEISFDLGYDSVSTFIAIFKEQFGISPTRYIRREKENYKSVKKLELVKATKKS